MNLILASSSPYRKKLLERLCIPFECHSPNIDETPLPKEAIENYVKRMSLKKGFACASHHPDAVILSSDQTAFFNNKVVSKPGSIDGAIQQLTQFSGHSVTFLTGVAVSSTTLATPLYRLSTYKVTFRKLTKSEITSYIEMEQPLDCAGSFKCEGLGIRLFERMEGDDPTALEGLPLIATCDLLLKAGLDPLKRG